MTLTQLQERVYAQLSSSHGHYRVEITYRGNTYTCITTNSLAYDSYCNPSSTSYYTEKQALQSLYDECKAKNKLR